MQSSNARIAIIGAGITGITCAHTLRGYGYHPTILEKSRGLGGRLATRRAGDNMAFDHGGPYFTARSREFQNFLNIAAGSGAMQTWQPLGKMDQPDGKEPWHTGAPAMNALLKPYSTGLDIRLKTQVLALAREDGGWKVTTGADSNPHRFDILICTAPAPQTRALLAENRDFLDAMATVTMAPCWAAMIAFKEPLHLGYEVLQVGSDMLDRIARDSSKTGRSASRDCWILQASPRWSQDNLERDREDVANAMREAFAQSVPAQMLPQPTHAAAHRWRYARTLTPLGRPFLASKDHTLFAGGDWCLGARVESGFESGVAIASSLADHLAGRAAP